MKIVQHITLDGLRGNNSAAGGAGSGVFPVIGLGVKGTYEIHLDNPAAMDADGIQSWMFAIGQDWNMATPVLFETSGVSYSNGVFTVSGMEGTRTNEMLAAIGDESQMEFIGELIGMDADEDKNHPLRFIQFALVIGNRVDG